MSPNLKLVISDPDPDYNGIDIVGTNDEFAGSAFVYFGLGELQKFSEGLSGFPSKFRDKREFEFGVEDMGAAGGYCRLVFVCDSGTGGCRIEMDLRGDRRYTDYQQTVCLEITTIAYEIDRFCAELVKLERNKDGVASLKPE